MPVDQKGGLNSLRQAGGRSVILGMTGLALHLWQSLTPVLMLVNWAWVEQFLTIMFVNKFDYGIFWIQYNWMDIVMVRDLRSSKSTSHSDETSQGHIQETGGVVCCSLVWICQFWGHWIPQGNILTGPFVEDVVLNLYSFELYLSCHLLPRKGHSLSFYQIIPAAVPVQIKEVCIIWYHYATEHGFPELLKSQLWVSWHTWTGWPAAGIHQEKWRALTTSVLLRKL